MASGDITFLERVCRALQHAGVDYAVVGGQAVALHGVVRGTVDVDVVLRWTRETVEKAAAALSAMGLMSRIPVTARDVFERRDHYVENRNLVAWNFYDPHSPIDEVDIIIAYDLEGKAVQHLELSSSTVAVLAVADLIEMKRRSGRPQDMADAAALEAMDDAPGPP